MARRKKPSGRAARGARGARGAPYDAPYWVDRARSLAELCGWPRADGGDGRGLVGRYQAAVNKPLGRLDEHDLETLFGQGADPHLLVPVALDLVRGGGGTARASAVLRCLVRLGDAFWRDHPHHLAELLAIVDAGPGDGGGPDDEAARFAAARRGR